MTQSCKGRFHTKIAFDKIKDRGLIGYSIDDEHPLREPRVAEIQELRALIGYNNKMVANIAVKKVLERGFQMLLA